MTPTAYAALSRRCRAGLLGAALALLGLSALAAPAAAEGLKIELNKLEDNAGSCLASFVVQNALGHTLDRFSLDLYVFDNDGVIARNVADRHGPAQGRQDDGRALLADQAPVRRRGPHPDQQRALLPQREDRRGPGLPGRSRRLQPQQGRAGEVGAAKKHLIHLFLALFIRSPRLAGRAARRHSGPRSPGEPGRPAERLLNNGATPKT